jgi:hypothetical protein
MGEATIVSGAYRPDTRGADNDRMSQRLNPRIFNRHRGLAHPCNQGSRSGYLKETKLLECTAGAYRGVVNGQTLICASALA